MNKVKEKRLSLNLSQEELAKKSGISRQVISKIENNEEVNVNVDTIKKISKVLKTKPEKLFF